MADLNELISLLGRQDEYGGTDSSVIDLKNLMLCDIPDFLDHSKDEEMLDEDVIKNFDDLLEQLTDTTEVEDYVQSVVDLMSAQLNGNSATPDKDDNGGDDNKGKGQPCKSVIVELAADTIKYSHEPFVWNVVPGQSIDSSTIIAYCKQNNKIVPVKSIFSKGVVRKD